jgi:hypothetical protein
MFQTFFVLCVFITFRLSLQISFRSKFHLEDWRADLINQMVDITDILNVDESIFDFEIDGENQVKRFKNILLLKPKLQNLVVFKLNR